METTIADLELFVLGFLTFNFVVIIIFSMILDSRITKLESKMRNKYVDRSRLI